MVRIEPARALWGRVSARRRALAAALLLAAAGAAILAVDFRRPYAGFEGELLLEIPKGTSTREMASLLKARGVIRREWHFWLMRALRRQAVLQAGEYLFVRPATAWEVYDRIARGDVHYYLVRVPEGSNMFEIAEIVGRLQLFSPAEFLAAAQDASLVADLAPAAPTLEGYLFPATYSITRRTTARDLCRMMTDKFRQVWRELGGAGDVHTTVTLASLVEKETAVAAERGLIASVFRNRLERGMRLQCDPTAIYAALLDGAYRGAIYRSDLDRRHAYNTYQISGLPPGPIANPGREALEATLRPPPSEYLYFVAKADGSGAHSFSTTLEAHHRAVARYRNGIQKAERQGQAR
jgi:UPF0755 protein